MRRPHCVWLVCSHAHGHAGAHSSLPLSLNPYTVISYFAEVGGAGAMNCGQERLRSIEAASYGQHNACIRALYFGQLRPSTKRSTIKRDMTVLCRGIDSLLSPGPECGCHSSYARPSVTMGVCVCRRGCSRRCQKERGDASLRQTLQRRPSPSTASCM